MAEHVARLLLVLVVRTHHLVVVEGDAFVAVVLERLVEEGVRVLVPPDVVVLHVLEVELVHVLVVGIHVPWRCVTYVDCHSFVNIQVLHSLGHYLSLFQIVILVSKKARVQ